MVAPPPLPPRFNQMSTVLAMGSLAWLAAAVVLLVTWFTGDRPLDIWFLTCVVGAGLGGVGYSVFAWQRAAARRGSRTAQQGLD
ncbi:MAG: hypothetical protein QOG20_2879 [Pseudonocardiales bacterium]|uniref:DUF2530 domain-containing protein n=1 Tax=Pseudonocardia sp. TaxID=60912 RepID=UPI00261335A5|nr:DUF2530 domain-containing protein [Pseudonocardia sp.]MCW2719140.1 hypothetical protein [Pseudonocardia sp.]MDT7614472.1 hypothetical protein [Pseudonocardiales bacterium]MDT7707272.1 hypothetical protein [Pseudonocardiales bacterium]